MKPPKATNGSSQSVYATAAAMPIATAPASETPASQARGGEAEADVELPEAAPDEASRDRELERGNRAAGSDDACELRQHAGRLVDIAEEVGERERGEGRIRERQLLGAPLDEPDPLAEPGFGHAPAALGEHAGALVQPDNGATVPARELDRDRAGPGRYVEDGVAGARVDARDEERSPPRILAEREHPR